MLDVDTTRLRVAVPAPEHHRALISCQVACPVHTDARGYVRAIAEGDFERAYLIARGPNPFASICGRVCGAPCEAACRRGKIPRSDADGAHVGDDKPIAIRALKRFVCGQAGVDAHPTDQVWQALQRYVPGASADVEELAALLHATAIGSVQRAAGQKIAIIGAGPAGLAAAHDLALLGFKPVVFEAEPVAAGMLFLGVPAYRLPRELIAREVALIQALGVEIRTGTRVGTDVGFASLRREHAAVILAVGAKRPRMLGLPGEAGPGVLGGVDFLGAVALGEEVPLGHDVVVVGGGNVAFDVARTVLRQIAYDAARTAARLPGMRRVRLVSLESLEEMPADTLEIVEGDEEGVQRLGGWGPVAIRRDGQGRVTGLDVQRCLRVYDAQRRFAPQFDPRDLQALEADTILFAAGQMPDLGFLADGGQDVEEQRPGWPKADPETLATSAAGVFVAGDLAHGTRLLIDAVASGKKVARAVYQHVTGRSLSAHALTSYLTLEPYGREHGYERLPRVQIPSREAAERLHDPQALVELGYGATAARCEASRCLDCGVTPVFDGARCVLCGGCADVCPTLCLKLVRLDQVEGGDELVCSLDATAAPSQHSAILKDEDRCIRCALCAQRCPTQAITMERVSVQHAWRNG